VKLKEWKRHDLEKLFCKIEFPATKYQRRLLKVLTVVVLWAGKYPVPFVFEKFTIRLDLAVDPELCIPGTLYSRSIDQSERRSLDELFSRLLEKSRG
jgi:hypothetical protein